MYLKISLVICIFTPCLYGQFVEYALPTPYVATSYHGRCFVVMVPRNAHTASSPKVVPHCIAYMIKSDGSFSQIWEVSGYFSNKVYLSDCGKFLIQIDPGRHVKMDIEQVGIKFFKNGKLTMKYSLKEILDLRDISPKRALRYSWYDSKSTHISANTFYLVTHEGTKYAFDLMTGKMLWKTTPNQRVDETP